MVSGLLLVIGVITRMLLLFLLQFISNKKKTCTMVSGLLLVIDVITRMLRLFLLQFICNTEENLHHGLGSARHECDYQDAASVSVSIHFQHWGKPIVRHKGILFVSCSSFVLFIVFNCTSLQQGVVTPCYYEVVGRRTLMKRKKRDWEGFRHRWLQSLEQRAQSACPCPMTSGGNRVGMSRDIVLIMGIRTGALKGTKSEKKRQSMYLKVSLGLLGVRVSALTRRSVSNDISDLV